MTQALPLVLLFLIVGLSVSMFPGTCLQHWYQGRFEAHHSIFEINANHKHSEPLSEEGHDCHITSAVDHLLLVLFECQPCVMPAQALLPLDQPWERLTPASPLAVFKGYHSPPVKPPTSKTVSKL